MTRSFMDGTLLAACALALGCTSFEPTNDGGADIPDAGPSGSVVIVPSSIDFGQVLINGQSAPAEFTIVGTGDTAALTVDVIGDDFAIEQDGCTGLQLIESQVCTVSVRYVPTVAGNAAASLEVLGKAAAVSGEGLEQGALEVTPANADFGSVEFGENSAPIVLTVTNTGQSPVAAVELVLTDTTHYRIASTTCDSAGSLDPSASCTADVVYSPNAEGAHLTTLVISGDSVTQAAVSVGGIGTRPDYTLNVSVLDITAPGQIISSPGGIDCPGDCDHVYPKGTVVTLTAIGNDFANWMGNCSGGSTTCVLTMDGPRSAAARFDDGGPPI